MKLLHSLKSNRMLSIVTAVILGASILSVNTWAGPEHSFDENKPKRCEKHGKHKFKHGDLSNVLTMLDKELALTEEQKTGISKVIEQYNPELKALHTRMRDAKESGKELLKKDSYDEAAIKQHAQEQAALLEKMIILKSKSKHAIHSFLTDAQKEKMEKKFEKHHKKMKKDKP